MTAIPGSRGTLVVINSTGRQTSSVIRVASAIGYRVRAQLRSATKGPKVALAQELASLQNVELVEGSLSDPNIVNNLFKGADVAFINTTFWGDEVAIGMSLAKAAKEAGIKHYIYSSLTDHKKCWGNHLPHLPYWATKHQVEEYIRSELLKDMPTTFVYAGIYNNNFSTFHHLPLWELQLADEKDGGGFVWTAPFDEDYKMPFLDAEHDTGPAVIQILKDGPQKWNGARIPLAFEYLNPREIAAVFTKALNRPFTYKKAGLEIKAKLPDGYMTQVLAIAELFGTHRADYFPPGMTAPGPARKIWRGWRGLEEYAREVFPIEEAHNGRTWMYGDEEDEDIMDDDEEFDEEEMAGSPENTVVGDEDTAIYSYIGDQKH
ncbi:hypothetical protein TWF569_004478 [Orbilia oligospora]|uniref:NmrA-like domain-containing protein n=1 Tax=Orbilia oligospora TaxID=2813651 RepID=A0A7C8K6N8_ORBOL|nr:hypothetical protein TWF706_010045 [Orbilia oligospora]KAF3118529.1 hypothetical protein TWF703_004950 [Orbilia oligospora]KAF3119008.1 hypothetical protein TWF569_004478 [Orbilia oligospora]KAF3133139.1 hypothetical protein TWF594_009354 [Orbilia oligospora]KAF3162945.1 hypothetical protein TWF751_010555 [Orbilia oligospora]